MDTALSIFLFQTFQILNFFQHIFKKPIRFRSRVFVCSELFFKLHHQVLLKKVELTLNFFDFDKIVGAIRIMTQKFVDMTQKRHTLFVLQEHSLKFQILLFELYNFLIEQNHLILLCVTLILQLFILHHISIYFLYS